VLIQFNSEATNKVELTTVALFYKKAGKNCSIKGSSSFAAQFNELNGSFQLSGVGSSKFAALPLSNNCEIMAPIDPS
jgi:hypothetical protein